MMLGFGFRVAGRVLHEAQWRSALAATGPYAHLRHSQYAGFILITLGFLVQWPAVLTLAIFPVLVWMYTRLARTEERDALAAFGDACTRSAANVPAFAPRVMPSRRGAGQPPGSPESPNDLHVLRPTIGKNSIHAQTLPPPLFHCEHHYRRTAVGFADHQIGLVAPYLPSMRQARRFREREAVTSAYFAQVVSRWVDSLVAVGPHLHRRLSLSKIYTVPTIALHAIPLTSAWIKVHIAGPVVVDPESESDQRVVAAEPRQQFFYCLMQRSGR